MHSFLFHPPIYGAANDMSKAFDMVEWFELFSTLCGHFEYRKPIIYDNFFLTPPLGHGIFKAKIRKEKCIFSQNMLSNIDLYDPKDLKKHSCLIFKGLFF